MSSVILQTSGNYKQYETNRNRAIKRMNHLDHCVYGNSTSHLCGLVPGKETKFQYLGGLVSAPRLVRGDSCPPVRLPLAAQFVPTHSLLHNHPEPKHPSTSQSTKLTVTSTIG